MTDFNTVEAVENGDSYVFIKRDMDTMIWYMTGFWTWHNLPDKGIFFIKAFPKKQRRRKFTQREMMSRDPKQVKPPLKAWSDQEQFDTKAEFWDYVDIMSLNSEVRIESRIYLETRQVLKPNE